MTDANYSDADAGTDSNRVVRNRGADEPASESVVRAVSEATGTDPLRMPRLADVVDPDALDTLFLGDSGWSEGDDGAATVSFRFNGCEVSVHANGRTVVSRSAGRSL